MVTDSTTMPREQIARRFLGALGYPQDEASVPESGKAFPDGGHYRVEIPSVEGPRCLEAVLAEADRLEVPVHRVSSGSGIALTLEQDIRAMAEICRDRQIELSLFVGPRAGWDPSAQARTPTGAILGARHEGTDQLVYAMADLIRANELGVRGALVADEGLLEVASAMKAEGVLSPDFVLKVSVQLMAPNPVSAAQLERLGAGSINVPPGLPMNKLAGIRTTTSVPIDMYVESPDTLGGFIRHQEVPGFVRALAPVYLKFGLRNHADVYPSGHHLEELNVRLGIERVRRAAVGLELLRDSGVQARMSGIGSAGVAVPERTGALTS